MASTTPFVNALVSGQLAHPTPTAPAPSPSQVQPSVAPAAPKGNTVYWIGTDGNAWVKGPDGGVKNYGKVSAYNDNGAEAALGSIQGNRIQDPNPGGINPNTTNNGNGSGTGGGSTFQDRSNDIAIQEAGLNAIPAEEAAGTKAVSDALAKIMGEYGDDLGAANNEYTQESNANQTDLQGNKEAALTTAQQGRRGLFGTLASLGALNGTGIELANNAVRNGANQDLTQAADTYATNQNGLDTSIDAYRRQIDRYKTQAQSAADNDTKIARNHALVNEQNYYKNLVADYQDEGNATLGSHYTQLAAGLQPEIAATAVPQIDIGYTGGAYTAPTLSSYVGRANNTTVQSTPGNGTSGPFNVPGLVATPKKQTTGVTV